MSKRYGLRHHLSNNYVNASSKDTIYLFLFHLRVLLWDLWMCLLSTFDWWLGLRYHFHLALPIVAHINVILRWSFWLANWVVRNRNRSSCLNKYWMCWLVIKSSPLFSVQIRCFAMCLHKLITEWHCSREKLVVSHQVSRNPRFRLLGFLSGHTFWSHQHSACSYHEPQPCLGG